MFNYIVKIFMIFIIFSFLGWCLEVCYGRVKDKKFVNRGFLIGPICPIYGVGVVLMYLLLSRYQEDPIVLFVMAMLVGGILEYLSSYVMEKLFKARWWDYSDMKYNINGRVCLETLIPFGLLGSLVIYLLIPVAYTILNSLSQNILYIVAGILFLIYLLDELVSLGIIINFKKTAEDVASKKDSTVEISKFVRETLKKSDILSKRLIESFPNFKLDIKKIKEKIKKGIRKNK